MYRVGICEDEGGLSEELCGLFDHILSHLGLKHELHTYPSADALGQVLEHGERFDLLCLDIIMPGQTGMELAHRLRERGDETPIIFITGSTDFLLEGYSVRPLQYLLKPVDPKKLEAIITDDIRRRTPPRAVTVCVGGKTTVLPLSDIQFIESRNHGCCFVLADREESFWLSMSRVESMLPEGQFSRCHNSYLVNLSQVVHMDAKSVELSGGATLPVSRLSTPFQSALTRFLNT